MNAEDNVDDDGDDDDDADDARKMMRLMWRRRKMMRLRRMMLRRKTDPKTGKHTLCQPAQATCAWTFYKSHFVWKFTGKMAADTSGDILFVRACAVEMDIDISQEPFCVKIYRENAKRPGDHLD